MNKLAKAGTGKITGFDNGHTVEMWYDRNSRLWITQHKDAEGNQIGDAEMDGDRVSAVHSYNYVVKMVSKFTQPKIRLS